MHACIYTHSTVHILYVTLCMGGSKGATKVMYVAHIGVLQLPWCATTSHWNAYNYARTTSGMHQDCFMK